MANAGTAVAMRGTAQHPGSYERRVLVAVTGMSPQIVTETIYALAVAGAPPFVPTEVRVVTTREGAQLIREALLPGGEGWLDRLRADYDLPPIAFAEEHLRVLRGATGEALSDIRKPADVTATADAITQVLCDLTRDDASALHVSIAGGRKTMGFYLGYALSLYGRAQDRLSHVLVSPPYESNPGFFYPSPETRMIPQRGDLPEIDAKNGEVSLAEIPFVRLRDGLPEELLNGEIRFHDAVTAAQRALGPAELTIDTRNRRVRAGGRMVELPPVQLAFLAWIARRQRQRKSVTCPSEGAPNRAYADEFLVEYRAAIGPLGSDESTASRLAQGMESTFFSQTKSKLHKELTKQLGKREAAPYLASRHKHGRQFVYRLEVDPRAIRLGACGP